jgi:hypothetical protein
MLAKLTCPDGREAVLDDDEVWRSADPALAARLNRHHSPARDGPAEGEPGRLRASQAARELGAALWLPPLPAGNGEVF